LKNKQATALTTIIDGSLPFNGADFSRMDIRLLVGATGSPV